MEKYFRLKQKLKKKKTLWDFPGGPEAKTLSTECRGPWFDPLSVN